eukprot:gene58180-79680_t
MGFLIYPTYRLQLIAIIAGLLLGLYLVLYRTSMGLVVRAGIENPGMVGILGINVRRAFLLVFAIGVVAVGLAGMLYAPVVAVTPDMGANFMAQSFVVIVLGGLGSFPGAVVGGLIAGEIISLTSADALRSDGGVAGHAPAGPVRLRRPGMKRARSGGLRAYFPELAVLLTLIAAPV